jgi:hypothetical protein
MTMAQHFGSICSGWQKQQHSLTPTLDWIDILIGLGDLLLVGSHPFTIPHVHVYRPGFGSVDNFDARNIVEGPNAEYGWSYSRFEPAVEWIWTRSLMTSSLDYVHVVWFFCINHQFFLSTWERHHLLHRKTTCGKLRFECCQSISRSGNGSVCSFGAGNQTISAACRHLPCDFSSRGLQQYYKYFNRNSSAIITHMVRGSWQVCSLW